MSTKSTLSIGSILLKQNRFASAHLCGTRKQVFDLFTLMHEWLFHRLFKKAYKLSTCLKASRLRRRRIFGVLLETRHSPRPLSLCLQSAHLWAAHADMCAVSITGSQIPFGNTFGAGVHSPGLLCLGLKPQKTFPVFRTFPGYCS